jgi:hypothetical protein
VKNTAQKMDRATLLKGGGTLALTAMIAGAMEARAEACCFPIDLSYGDVSSLERTAAISPPRPKKVGNTGFTAVKIWAPGRNGSPQPVAPWTLLFTADNAAVKGYDENQHGHGKDGGSSQPNPLGGKIFVYVK